MKWKALSVFSCLILLTGEPVFPESCALTHPGIILQLLRALKLTASVSQTVEHPSRQAGDGALIKYLAEFDLSIQTGLNVCDGAVLKIKCHMKWNEVEAPLDVKWLLIINSWFNHRRTICLTSFPSSMFVCVVESELLWRFFCLFTPNKAQSTAKHALGLTSLSVHDVAQVDGAKDLFQVWICESSLNHLLHRVRIDHLVSEGPLWHVRPANHTEQETTTAVDLGP